MFCVKIYVLRNTSGFAQKNNALKLAKLITLHALLTVKNFYCVLIQHQNCLSDVIKGTVSAISSDPPYKLKMIAISDLQRYS